MSSLLAAPLRDASAPLPRHPGVDSARLLTPDRTPTLAAEHYRGMVDSLSLSAGLCGWLIDLRDPLMQLDLELVVQDRAWPCEVERLHRQDIWVTDDPTVAPGFRVRPEGLLALAAEDLDPDAPIELRLVGQPLHLQAGVEWPTVGQLQRWIGDAEHAVGAGEPTDGLALPLALGRHFRHAQGALKQSQRAADSLFLGFVERVVHLDAHHSVLFGWTQRPVTREQAVVVVCGGRRLPAALVMVPYPRDDLPAGALAYVAVLHSTWRVSSVQEQSFFFLQHEQGGWLRTHQPLHMESAGDLRALIERLMAQVSDRRLGDLQRLIGQTARWVPTPERAAAAGVQVHLDRILLLPGFGALVQGWLISAGAGLELLHLQVGQTLLVLDRGTLQQRARPDLGEAFPAQRDRVARAGFSAVLRGPLAAEDWDQPLLALTLSDGLELVLPVPAAQMRRIDHAFDFASLDTMFPALEHEPWLDDLARALREQVMQQQAPRVQLLERVRSDKMLLMALPQDPAHLTLVLDRLHQQAATLPADVAVALLVDPRHPRERVLRWCAALRAVLGPRRLGLVQVPDVSLAFYLVPRLRAMLGLQRFAFVGDQVLLQQAGWRWLGEPARWQGSALAWPGVSALSMGRAVVRAESQAFVWSVAEFEAHFRRLPFLLGGLHGRNGLPEPAGPLDEQALRLGSRRESGLAARVNQALLQRVETALAAPAEPPESA